MPWHCLSAHIRQTALQGKNPHLVGQEAWAEELEGIMGITQPPHFIDEETEVQ